MSHGPKLAEQVGWYVAKLVRSSHGARSWERISRDYSSEAAAIEFQRLAHISHRGLLCAVFPSLRTVEAANDHVA